MAAEVGYPTTFGLLLHDRFLANNSQGRGEMDWSELGRTELEEAGGDVTDWLPIRYKSSNSGDSIAPK